MDYDKVDAGLANALDRVTNPEARSLSVLIRTDAVPTHEQVAILRRLGAGGAIEGKQVVTAMVSPRMVDELTRQGWIRYLRLASPLQAY